MVHRVEPYEPEIAASMLTTVWLMSRAPLIVANSASNIGSLILTMSATRSQGWERGHPHLIDLDEVLTEEVLWTQRGYACNLGYAQFTGACGPAPESAARDLLTSAHEGRQEGEARTPKHAYIPGAPIGQFVMEENGTAVRGRCARCATGCHHTVRAHLAAPTVCEDERSLYCFTLPTGPGPRCSGGS